MKRFLETTKNTVQQMPKYYNQLLAKWTTFTKAVSAEKDNLRESTISDQMMQELTCPNWPSKI